MMKKYLIIAFVLAAALTFSIKDAMAVTFAGGEINDVYFNNAENWVDRNRDGEISRGDYFYGILHVQDIVGRSSGTVWNEDNVTPGLDTFTGYFLTSVTGVTLDGGVQPHITLGTFTGAVDPYGILSAGELASGVVMKLWTDTSTKWTDSINILTDIANSTDGIAWATFTADGGYWYTHAPLIPPIGSGNTVGESFLGLNLVTNNSGLTFGLVNDPNESEIDVFVNLTGQSEIEVGDNHWGFQSNDPVFADIIPEPGTMFLLGSGLIGLGFYARRKVSK